MTFVMVRMTKILIKFKMIQDIMITNVEAMLIQVTSATETFLWQLEGSAVVTHGDGEQVVL